MRDLGRLHMQTFSIGFAGRELLLPMKEKAQKNISGTRSFSTEYRRKECVKITGIKV